MQIRSLISCSALGLILSSVQIVHAGIVSSGGAVVVIPAPASVQNGDLENNTQIRVFNEQQNVTILQSDLNVDITVPGTSPSATDTNLSTGVIPVGTQISSYFVHFDRIHGSGGAVTLSGSVTFDSDILGLIVLSNTLNLSDVFPGLFGTSIVYPEGNGGRGLELTDATDAITLSADRRTVTMTLLSNQAMDQVRIITTPEPCAELFAILMIVLGSQLRLRPATCQNSLHAASPLSIGETVPHSGQRSGVARRS